MRETRQNIKTARNKTIEFMSSSRFRKSGATAALAVPKNRFDDPVENAQFETSFATAMNETPNIAESEREYAKKSINGANMIIDRKELSFSVDKVSVLIFWIQTMMSHHDRKSCVL